ncbi:MAG: SDR family NAD(P)-dependent oxidoreductase [Hyphomicrobiaceae bacterium]
MPLPWRTAWITGASSGIGRALALSLARQGVLVAASARSHDGLASLSAEEGRIRAYALDVTDRAAVADAHKQIVADLGGIDLAVLNAGVWHPMKATAYSAEHAADSMAVNYLGVANAVEALIPDMVQAGRGQIALVASVAGYRGLPKAAAYAPSKAAVISLAEVLRLELARHGIRVNLINPGFVDTPMTATNRFPMPFIIKADDAAARIIRGLAKGRFEIAFPWQLVALLKLARTLPYALYFKLAGRTNT